MSISWPPCCWCKINLFREIHILSISSDIVSESLTFSSNLAFCSRLSFTFYKSCIHRSFVCCPVYRFTRFVLMFLYCANEREKNNITTPALHLPCQQLAQLLALLLIYQLHIFTAVFLFLRSGYLIINRGEADYFVCDPVWRNTKLRVLGKYVLVKWEYE